MCNGPSACCSADEGETGIGESAEVLTRNWNIMERYPALTPVENMPLDFSPARSTNRPQTAVSCVFEKVRSDSWAMPSKGPNNHVFPSDGRRSKPLSLYWLLCCFHLVPLCFHTTGCEAFSYGKVDMGSLTRAVIFVRSYSQFTIIGCLSIVLWKSSTSVQSTHAEEWVHFER